MHESEKKEILARARNIAILGLSPEPSKASNAVARYLIAQGYNVIPIYPRLSESSEILGCRAYKSLQEAFSDEALRNLCGENGENGEIDILNVFRKSEALRGIAREILELKNKPKCVWVQLGLRNEGAKEMLQNAGIAYEQDSCIKLEHQRLLI